MKMFLLMHRSMCTLHRCTPDTILTSALAVLHFLFTLFITVKRILLMSRLAEALSLSRRNRDSPPVATRVHVSVSPSASLATPSTLLE